MYNDNSRTYHIPGYPGYYYRPSDGAIISNKTNQKYRSGTLLKIYHTTTGEPYVNLMDYTNCRRKVTIEKIVKLIQDEFDRLNNLNKVTCYNSGYIQPSFVPVSNHVIGLTKHFDYQINMASHPISLDEDGNIIKKNLIVFIKE